MGRNNSALLVIDMQNGFLNESSPLFIDGAPETVPACTAVISACREKGIPVFFVRRIYNADGSNVEHIRLEAWGRGGKPLSPECPQETPAEMPRYSAFFSTELDLILRRLGVRHVILTGTTTPNCIRASCYDAISLDYAVTVLSDCTSSKTAEIQKSNLRDMANIGAEITDSDTFLRNLTM